MNTKNHTDRVVVLVDMDCFYCQVEEKLDSKLAGKPIAVVQYNQWRGGGIIAVNYPARDRGVSRHMRGNEAKEKCPEIELIRVPNVRGKADLSKYREAGKRVAEVLQTFTPLLERASVDEAYMDITEAVNKRIYNMSSNLTIDSLKNTHVVGCQMEDFLYNVYNNEFKNDDDLKLIVGGVIVEEIRAAVYEKTGYRCSAGIAHNKILAKLACGLHKPNKQTILPQSSVPELYESLPLKKIKSLGGKFGESLSEVLNITYMGQLINFSEKDLLKKYDEKTASWLFNIAHGIDLEPVTVRLVSKSIGCCKKFPGKAALKTVEDVMHWLMELATEIEERLEQDTEENKRRAKQLIISFAQPLKRKDIHSSKSLNLNSYDAKKISSEAFDILKKMTQKSDGSFNLTFLGLSVGKFETINNKNDISVFFKNININKTKNCVSFDTTKAVTEQKDDMNNESIDLDDIEQDAKKNSEEINLNETLKDIQNIKSISDNIIDSAYLEETIKIDYSDQLKNKKEFPYFNNNNNNSGKESVDTSKSFFMKFLQDNVKPNSVEQSILNQPSTSSSNNLNPSTFNYINQDSNSSSNGDGDSSVFDEFEFQSCPECNKKITKTELISHMDYHLAEKLMSEEKKLFQNELQAKKLEQLSKNNTLLAKNSKPTSSKSVKRKSTDNNQSIMSYLSVKNKNKENIDFEMERCPECDKNIRTEDFPCHLDYHAAKKLHMELNPVKIEQNKSKLKINTCKKATNLPSITSFFDKRVEN